MEDIFNIPQSRDRSLEIKCSRCAVSLARIEIKAVFRIGMYICERCFKKLIDLEKSVLNKGKE